MWLMSEKYEFIGEMLGKLEITFQPFLYFCTCDNPTIAFNQANDHTRSEKVTTTTKDRFFVENFCM